MKNKLFLLLLCMCFQSFAQTKTNEIAADGNAKLRVKPNLAVFKIEVNKKNEVEKTALKELNEEVEKLQLVFTKLGLLDKNIKISNYSISSEQFGDQKKEYSASNDLTIEFLLDNKFINAFYKEIQSNNFKDVEINFETFLSDDLEKSTRKKFVEMAIADAKNNAETIAKALNLSIVDVKPVSKFNERSYDLRAGVDNIKFDKPKYGMASMDKMAVKTSFEKYDVEEKELEEQITIVFEIVKK